jgi:peptide/nickel transport system ATP-binding protein
MSLLCVDGLSVTFGKRPKPAVSRVSFSIEPRERLGIIGESGSGKSVTALAIMGLLPEYARISGSIALSGKRFEDIQMQHQELVGLPDSELAIIRGGRVSMVFQEPMTALDPTMRVGRQIAEVFRLHGGLGAVRARVVEELAKVGLAEPERIADSYPHQLSGGQRQRALIAMALINRPELVIFDEPTTALDVTVQAQVLALINSTLNDSGASCLFISHDLAVVSQVCSKLLVMKDGEVIDSGTVDEIFSAPKNEYTARLVTAALASAEVSHG